MKKANKFLLMLIITLAYQTISTSSFSQGVGINADGSSAHGSAMLDIKSTTSGVIIPRMTTAQRDNIATACSCTPIEGLLIYNTETKCFEAYNATTASWVGFGCIGCILPSAPAAGTHTPSQTQIVWNWNTVSGATGYKYNTTNNYGTATDNGASTINTQTSLTCNIAYTLYVWAYNSCGNSAATTLTQTTTSCCTLIASAGSNQTTSCVVIGGTPTASGGTPGYTYAWNPSTGLSNSTVANPTANPASSTTYSVTVSDAGGCTATSSMSVTITPTLLNNIISYWKLDEASGNVTDNVGSNTLTNTGVTFGTGKINNSAVFNSTTDVLKTTTYSPFDFERTDPFSISAWVYINTLIDNACIVSHQIMGGDWNGWKTYAATNGVQRFCLISGNGGGGTGVVVATPAGALTTGSWLHIVVTSDGSSTAAGIKIYINGVSQTLTTELNNSTGSMKNAEPFNVGNWGDVYNYGGTIDELGIWSRVLTPCEISTLYNSGNGLQYPF